MKFTLEFDTTVDRYQDLQKFVDAVKPKTISTATQNTRTELENLLEPTNSKPTKVVGIKNKKRELSIGTHWEEGVQIVVHPFEEFRDNTGLAIRNYKAYHLRAPNGVIHIFPNMSAFSREQNLGNGISTIANTPGKMYKGWSNVQHLYGDIQPYIYLKTA